MLAYEAPKWAYRLKNIPNVYVELARRPTPIQRWHLPGLPTAFQVSIKRDDLSGCSLTGNKVRKLEFLLADALQQGYDSIITCGDIHSNNCRTTALAARELGLKCHLVLTSSERVRDSQCCLANVALDRLAGAEVYLVPEDYSEEIFKLVLKLKDRIWEERKEKAYPIPNGGSNNLGAFGYIEAFQEMMNQNLLEEFDDIVVPVGSGGTVASLAIANYLTGSKLKVHGISVSGIADRYYKHAQKALDDFGLDGVHARDIFEMINDYIGRGYAKSTDDEFEQLIEISQSTGILVDPTYNLKAVRGMLAEMDNNPTRFKGSRVLYIHTGGIFRLFDNRLDRFLLNGVKEGRHTFKIWDNAADDPLAL